MSLCILSTCSYLYAIPPPPSLQAFPHSALLSHSITHIYTNSLTHNAAALANMNALVSRQIAKNILETGDLDSWRITGSFGASRSCQFSIVSFMETVKNASSQC